ncbi:molybdopterin-dependent oxidoreductase [Phenylobacterium sp. LjRoot225]|uniref:molybdopterin-containing oxidoreductase family protein n=1 Tax=Phenylobacterium sp. LjRoot225 TaxID=3342285 RepID=UPI003ECEB4F0
MSHSDLQSDLPTGVRTERSYCRVCTSQCGILVDLEGDQVVKVRGDRDHPVTHGYTCPKGRALKEMHHHPQRIERPLIKTANGLEPTSWEALFADIGPKLRRIIDEHGPAAVGIFYGSGVGMDASGYRMSEALQAAIGTPAKFSPLTIDGTAKTLVSTLVGGFPGFSPRPDYDRVDLVLYIGINPMISHGHTVAMPNPAPTIKAAAARGEVWVIDPRQSETAGFASHHMAPRPGADYAILAYLVRDLLAVGVDPEVLGRTVDAEALAAAVAPFDLAHASEISGVAEAELTALLASVRRAGRLAVETGTGVTMSDGANLTQWLAWVLMILTDSMNRPGGVWFHPGFNNQMDAAPLPIIDQPFGPGPKSRPELPSFVGDWPCAALPDEIAAGNIKAFLNLGGNIIRSFPDANALTAGLSTLEVFATLEIIENETSAASTHVLPTKDQLERPDFGLWDFLSPRVDAQFTPAAVSAVGDRRSAWWILSELIRSMGFEPPATPGDDRAEGADLAMLSGLLPYARCSFDELVEKRYVEVATPQLPAAWVDAHVERLGGWRLAPSVLVDRLATLSRRHLEDRRLGTSLSLIPRRQRRHVNAQFLFLGDTPEMMMNPGDAAALGVEDGQQIIVRSARGEVTGTARVDAKVRPGVVSVPHGHQDANVNLLTSTRQVDPLTGMALYSGVPVSVHPVTAAVPAPELV